jgi:hypothetical protein
MREQDSYGHGDYVCKVLSDFILPDGGKPQMGGKTQDMYEQMACNQCRAILYHGSELDEYADQQSSSSSGISGMPEALRMESRRISSQSPPASHMENPFRPRVLMNSPLAANDCASS